MSVCSVGGAQFYKPFAERLGRAVANRRLVAAVGAARPRINNLPPARFSHLADNRKRRSLAEGAPLAGSQAAVGTWRAVRRLRAPSHLADSRRRWNRFSGGCLACHLQCLLSGLPLPAA